MEQLEVKEKPNVADAVKFDLPHGENFQNRIVIRINPFDKYVGYRHLFHVPQLFIKGGQKIGFIGGNGVGKTTFIKELMNAEHPEITFSPQVAIGYFAQDLSTLNPNQSILANVSKNSIQSEATIRTVLARLHFYDEDVYKLVDVLSGGERIKIQLAKLILGPYNTLILDEPTNYLDIQTLEVLESILADYAGTLIVISHDVDFIGNICNTVMTIKDEHLQLFDGTYEQWLQAKDKDKTHDERAE